MSSDEQSQKERRLRELQRLLKRGSEEYREDVSLRRNEELTKVQIIVREAVMTVAVAEGYNLIVEFPVYASPEVNITNKGPRSIVEATLNNRSVYSHPVVPDKDINK